MSYRYTFTVFTPAYNRAETLHRVLESLEAQTFRDFEWVIVDDGSTDHTRDLVRKWQKEADFPIRYFWQENSGKHIAINRGVREAQGRFFLTLDSDDACVPEALERLKYHWETIPEAQRDRFSAVTVLCRDQDGNLVGTRFPWDVTDSNSLEIRHRYNVKGENWGFQRTDVMKQFPFPVLEGARFVPEGVVWNAIARRFKTRYVNEALRIYWSTEDGHSDQLSNTKNPAKHAVGLGLRHQLALNDEIDWLRFAPRFFLRSAALFTRFSLHAGIGIIDQMRRLNNPLAIALWIVTLPIGIIVYLSDQKES